MKRLCGLFSLAFLFTAFSACETEDPATPSNPNITFLASLSGAAEVPPNASMATGTATMSFNTTTKVLTLSVTHNIATPTAAHIHVGATTVAGPPEFTIPTASPINYTSPPLTSTQEANLMANLYYVNIHTAAFPTGEIRGQLIKQ